MKCYNTIIFISYFLSSFLIIVNSELFTAIDDLQNLLNTEGEIIKSLEKYLELEEQRLQKIRWLIKDYDKLYKAASHDVEAFLSNPVNAYLLVKRLTADWKAAENLIDGQIGREIMEYITHQGHLKFPDFEDLNGAAFAIIRLQDTYLLDTSTLASGIIEGTVPSPELTGGDCFELGRQAYNFQDYYHAVLWMQEALDRVEKENVKSVNKAEVLEYMAYSTYMLGNVRHAVKLTEELLNVEPRNFQAHRNLQYYSDMLKKDGILEKDSTDNATSEIQSGLFKKPEIKVDAFIYEYEKLCRGENVKTPADERDLRCHYFTNNNSFLILQPVKEEELHLSPRLVVYHDILSDKEIEVIKYLAKPKLARAKVQPSLNSGKVHSSYRISKSAWLTDYDHEVIRRISQRFGAITGLEIDTSESLQVVNYGIGGHYIPHYDFLNNEGFHSGIGDRIATWINYMSNVEAGGATVFPSLGVQVKPIKGSAGFWYNLLRNGEGNYDTLHAACPVLAGSKWVSNKWFHERGQEFTRPCTLDPEE